MIRIKMLLAVSLLALSSSPMAQQAGKAPWERYGDRIAGNQEIQVLSDDLFGDQVGLGNGSLSFAATDVSLPGAGPAISIGRTYTVRDMRHRQTDGMFGDWDAAIPTISAVHAKHYGWVDSNGNRLRCSVAGSPFEQLDGVVPSDYWQGPQIDIPGVTSGELLQTESGAPTPATGGPWRWLTNDGARVSCLSSLKNGGGGEGFLVVTPDGIRYWFDWMAEHHEPTLKVYTQNFNPGGPAVRNYHEIRRVVLYVTRVEDRFGNVVTYTYDALDNLRSWTRGAGGGDPGKDYATYEYDASNRLSRILGSAGQVRATFTWDVQGNLDKRDWGMSAARDFNFDFGNRNRGIAGVEGFRYDAHGRRVSTWMPQQGLARFYLYSRDGQLLMEANETAGANIQHVYLGGSLVADVEFLHVVHTTRTRYQHTDGLGSPVAISDEAGNVVERIAYEPFGHTIGGTRDGVGYTGHVMDPQSGLTYMQQRYYDPVVGRFLSVDPVAADTIGGLNFNRYNYGANNPYRFTDPDGRMINDPNPRPLTGGTRIRSSCEVTTVCLGKTEEESQESDYGAAKTDESKRQGIINRMHRAGGFRGPPPIYDPELPESGAVDAIDGSASIGPPAFEFDSAADLGSVIFHEVQVHQEQFRLFGDYAAMKEDNRLHVLEHEAHTRSLTQENPFINRTSGMFRNFAETEAEKHLGRMNEANRRLVEAGGTCATNFCSGARP